MHRRLTMKCFFVLAAIAALAQSHSTPAGVPCLRDDECSLEECCYKKHDELVVSKRQGTFEGFPIPHHQPKDYSNVTGVCQPYHLEGQYCSIYDKRNGYCSCNEKMGMTCRYVSEHVITKKRNIFLPGSWSFKCTKELLLSK